MNKLCNGPILEQFEVKSAFVYTQPSRDGSPGRLADWSHARALFTAGYVLNDDMYAAEFSSFSIQIFAHSYNWAGVKLILTDCFISNTLSLHNDLFSRLSHKTET